MKIAITTIIILSLSFTALAGQEKRTIRIRDFTGKADIKKNSIDYWFPVNKDMAVLEGDTLRTGTGSRIVIIIEEGKEESIVEIKEDSEVNFTELREDRKRGIITTLLDVLVGGIIAQPKKNNNKESKFEIKTPTSVIDAKEVGSSFSVDVEKEE